MATRSIPPAHIPLPARMPRKTRHPLYDTWRSMCRRCHDPRFPQYPRYGARGITVCDRWRYSFETFVADVGMKPGPGYTLEREDNDGPYDPKNVRWATKAEQNRNQRTNRRITVGDVTQISADWERENGLYPGTIARRVVHSGWSEEEAVTRPAQTQAPKNTFLPNGAMQLCRARGIPYSVVSNRVRVMDWTFEEALETPVQKRGTWTAKLTHADHVHILERLAQGETQQAIAQDYGVDRSQLSRLLKKTRQETRL